MKLFIFLLLVKLTLAKLNPHVGPGYDCNYCQPEQIHISFGCKYSLSA